MLDLLMGVLVVVSTAALLLLTSVLLNRRSPLSWARRDTVLADADTDELVIAWDQDTQLLHRQTGTDWLSSDYPGRVQPPPRDDTERGRYRPRHGDPDAYWGLRDRTANYPVVHRVGGAIFRPVPVRFGQPARPNRLGHWRRLVVTAGLEAPA